MTDSLTQKFLFENGVVNNRAFWLKPFPARNRTITFGIGSYEVKQTLKFAQFGGIHCGTDLDCTVLSNSKQDVTELYQDRLQKPCQTQDLLVDQYFWFVNRHHMLCSAFPLYQRRVRL